MPLYATKATVDAAIALLRGEIATAVANGPAAQQGITIKAMRTAADGPLTEAQAVAAYGTNILYTQDPTT